MSVDVAGGFSRVCLLCKLPEWWCSFGFHSKPKKYTFKMTLQGNQDRFTGSSCKHPFKKSAVCKILSRNSVQDLVVVA